MNRRLIEENAVLLGIPVTIFESDIFGVTVQVEKNPCYLCARMRRGSLYSQGAGNWAATRLPWGTIFPT